MMHPRWRLHLLKLRVARVNLLAVFDRRMGAACPVCGRFPGASKRCPRCGKRA